MVCCGGHGNRSQGYRTEHLWCTAVAWRVFTLSRVCLVWQATFFWPFVARVLSWRKSTSSVLFLPAIWSRAAALGREVFAIYGVGRRFSRGLDHIYAWADSARGRSALSLTSYHALPPSSNMHSLVFGRLLTIYCTFLALFCRTFTGRS